MSLVKDTTTPISGRLLSWPPLTEGILIKRYKRFMADVLLNDDRIVTAHCPNSGSMLGCCEPGRSVYLSESDNPKRRLRYTWEMISVPTSLVGVNTLVPNRLVRKAAEMGLLTAFQEFRRVRAEVPYGTNSRIDLLLENDEGARCYVEVKNCTLVEGDRAYFPDAVTSRGLKHLVELQRVVDEGGRGVMLILIQRMDA
ncbi:MAG: DNA/RNA nuclease SfsA, partial [Pseudomonadota bacterium]